MYSRRFEQELQELQALADSRVASRGGGGRPPNRVEATKGAAPGQLSVHQQQRRQQLQHQLAQGQGQREQLSRFLAER
jgi:hypothetical protein